MYAVRGEGHGRAKAGPSFGLLKRFCDELRSNSQSKRKGGATLHPSVLDSSVQKAHVVFCQTDQLAFPKQGGNGCAGRSSPPSLFQGSPLGQTLGRASRATYTSFWDYSH